MTGPANSTINPNVPGLDTGIASGQRVTTRQSEFLASASAGAIIAALVDPYGSGSTYSTIGTVPAQLALSGGNIVKGAGAAVAGTEYKIKVMATSADGQRDTSSILSFVAKAAAPTPTPTPTVTLSAAISRAEGNSGANLYVYTVTRSATAGAVAVPWSFTAGGASADDFTGGVYPAGGNVNMADGVATGTFTVSVNGDAVVEGDETFTVLISTPPGYVAGASMSATGTILNDDVATPTLAAISTTGLLSRYNPNFGAAPTTVVDTTTTTPTLRVTSLPDLVGSNTMTGANTSGAKLYTDETGKKWLRFEGYEFMTIAAMALNSRDCSVWMKVRSHSGTTSHFFSFGGGAAAHLALTNMPVSTSAANMMRAGTICSTEPQHMIGCETAWLGAHGRTTALGGTRFDRDTTAQTGLTQITSAIAGTFCEIGRNAYANGAAGTWGTFDVEEIIVYSTANTDAIAASNAAALAANAGTATVKTKRLVCDGDSITQGVGNTPFETPNGPFRGSSYPMQLANPNSPAYIGPEWSVVSVGISGNQTSDQVNRRNHATGWTKYPLPGGDANNKVISLIGRNDLVTGGKTGAQLYADVVAYWNTAISGSVGGVLQQGWAGKQAMGLGIGNVPTMTKLTDFRNLLNTAQFQTDTTVAGRSAGVVRTDDIRNPGNSADTLFLNSADAGDTIWFQGDATHPTAAGNVELAKAIAASFQ